jgi:hypothetical protein
MAHQIISRARPLSGLGCLYFLGICVLAYGAPLLLEMSQLVFSVPAGPWKLLSGEVLCGQMLSSSQGPVGM